jgi:hypothetical protein
MSVKRYFARQIGHNPHHFRILLLELAHPHVLHHWGENGNRLLAGPISRPLQIHHKTIRVVKLEDMECCELCRGHINRDFP